VIGGGSNLLFDDAGFDGVIVRIGSSMSRVEVLDDGVVSAEAGAWVPWFVRTALRAGLAGSEHAIGIPGTMGGLILMNGGSQRKGIGDQLLDVTIADPTGALVTLDREACHFSYRSSALQRMDAIIVGARFKYAPGDPRQLRKTALKILVDRSAKFPRKLPNCGSVFLSDPQMYDKIGPPGLAIERVGLKGASIGDAQISPLHANFIVNRGAARSTDVLDLIQMAKSQVLSQTGFSMACEVRYVSPIGVVQPADMV
jgi:UDP-N-acetylmuramate dehydrogenase